MFDFDDDLSPNLFGETCVEDTPREVFDMEVWETDLRELSKQDAANRWKLGELLVKGELAIPDFSDIPGAHGEPTFYARAAAITGMAPNSLKDIASTFKRAASVRTDACSWSHHRVLVNELKRALPRADEEAKNRWLSEWLSRAAEEKLSVAKLTEAVRRKPRVAEKSIRVTLPLAVLATLKDFADAKGSTVQKIAAKWLQETAESEDKQLERNHAKSETDERRTEKRRASGRRLQRNFPGKHFS